jgi:hypothetical protein
VFWYESNSIEKSMTKWQSEWKQAYNLCLDPEGSCILQNLLSLGKINPGTCLPDRQVLSRGDGTQRDRVITVLTVYKPSETVSCSFLNDLLGVD